MFTKTKINGTRFLTPALTFLAGFFLALRIGNHGEILTYLATFNVVELAVTILITTICLFFSTVLVLVQRFQSNVHPLKI
jgi:hypothetical protein